VPCSSSSRPSSFLYAQYCASIGLPWMKTGKCALSRHSAHSTGYHPCKTWDYFIGCLLHCIDLISMKWWNLIGDISCNCSCYYIESRSTEIYQKQSLYDLDEKMWFVMKKYFVWFGWKIYDDLFYLWKILYIKILAKRILRNN
jgi:hypothetical protein